MRSISKIIVALVLVIIFLEFLLLRSIHKRQERALVIDSESDATSPRGSSMKKQVEALKTSDVFRSTRNEQISYGLSPGM